MCLLPASARVSPRLAGKIGKTSWTNKPPVSQKTGNAMSLHQILPDQKPTSRRNLPMAGNFSQKNCPPRRAKPGAIPCLAPPLHPEFRQTVVPLRVSFDDFKAFPPIETLAPIHSARESRAADSPVPPSPDRATPCHRRCPDCGCRAHQSGPSWDSVTDTPVSGRR